MPVDREIRGNDVFYAMFGYINLNLHHNHLDYQMTIWGNPPPFKPDPPKKGKVITPEMLATGSEDGEQAALFCWAADNVGKYPCLKWLHAIPNGGSRHIAEATKMVAAGLRKGVLDVFLPYGWIAEQHGINTYHGCYIELKTAKRRKEKNGGLTDEQIDFMLYCGANGYYCKVCYGWEEARDTLIAYLEGKV